MPVKMESDQLMQQVTGCPVSLGHVSALSIMIRTLTSKAGNPVLAATKSGHWPLCTRPETHHLLL